MLATEPPFALYFDKDGDPLDNGRIYFGLPNQNPETSPITVFWDFAGTQPADQPLRTLNGYIVRHGTPSQVFVDGDYSVSVRDRRGRLLVYAPTSVDYNVALQVNLLRADLRSSSGPALGAGMNGFDWTQPYPVDTTGGALRQSENIRKFGNFVGDGVADDSLVWIAAAASGASIIDARGVTSKVLSTINIQSNQTWLLDGARIVTEGSALTVFSAVQKTNWHLRGPFRITGDLVTDPGTGVTAKGVFIQDCSNWSITNPQFFSIRGYGIHMVPGASSRGRADGGVVTNPRFHACVWGWKDEPGSGAEYCTVTNAHATGCSQTGIETAAGNIIWQGGHAVDNIRDGLRLRGGSNNCHGMVIGMNCNHNGQFNLHAKDVNNGESLIGCHFYANGPGVGVVWLENSKGIVIEKGHLDCWVYNDSGGLSGLNYLREMYCPGGYGPVNVLSVVAGREQLIVRGNYGPGALNLGLSINAAGDLWALAERPAGTTAALTSGVAATLICPTESSVLNDWRGVYNTATGEWTIPAGEDGWYEIKGQQVFGGTTMDTTASFLDLQVDTGSGYAGRDVFFLSTVFGAGTNAAINHQSTTYLNAGNKVRLRMTLTGTGTLTHGRAGWRCFAELRKIA